MDKGLGVFDGKIRRMFRRNFKPETGAGFQTVNISDIHFYGFVSKMDIAS
jgi:hypothetical protein